jgi:chitinase
MLLDGSVGYIAMIKQLRSLFALNPCKEYLITGAPQCAAPDANMGTMIAGEEFDIIWVQFYNTPACSARTWVAGNAAVNDSLPATSAGFTYMDWVNVLNQGASRNAKLYIGLMGSPVDSTAHGDFLWPTEVKNLIETYHGQSKFGGVMLWEAAGAYEQIVEGSGRCAGPMNYNDYVKCILSPYAPRTTPTAPVLCPVTTTSR